MTRDGIVLRDHRIVLPKTLRARVVELAHGGHQCIVKTKRLLRSRVWFHGIDELVEPHIKICQACQANSDRQVYEPLKPSKMPEKPWPSISGDFFGPTEGGWYWFVNICEHSNKADVAKIRATNDENTETVLDRLFTTFGAPVVYKTDNGSPFQSHNFKAFAKKWGFEHRRVTPEWPRANGKAESFMKKLGKVLRTAKIEGQNEQVALQEFLRRYNETPHSTTGISPNHLMLGFSRSSGIPSKLPETPAQREMWRQTALANDARAKQRMEEEYNVRMKVREPLITVGSEVLIKLKRHRKSTPAWDVDRPLTVTDVKGSMVTATRHDLTTTRNSSTFKLFRRPEYDDPQPLKQVEAYSERREEATPTSPGMQAQQVRCRLPATKAPHAEVNAEQHANAPAEAPPAASRGRPTRAESDQRLRERSAKEAARRAANPPTRSSTRIRSKSSAERNGTNNQA